MTGNAATARPTIVNPVLHGFHPDPSWMWHSGRAWLVTSSFGMVPGLPIHTSADLAHWEPAGAAIDERMGERLFLQYIASDNRGVFAPSIRELGDAIVIVSTVTSIDADRALADGADPDEVGRMRRAHGNFALVSHDEGRTWEGPRWIEGAVGNDPDLFVDADGSTWWLATHQSYDQRWPYQSDVYLSRLDTSTWSLTGPEHVLWHGALEGATWAESPHLLRRDGRYYLFAAEAGTARHHAQSVARSDELTRYFDGDPCNPVLSHRQLGEGHPVQNIGHSDVLRDDDGRWWGVCLGSRTVDGLSFMGREPFVFPIDWNDEGWPVFAPGRGLVSRVVGPVEGTDPAPRTPVADADGWPVVAIPRADLIRIPLHPEWLWTKIDHGDFAVVADPGHANELRIRQDETHYASLVFDRTAGTVTAILRDGDDERTPWGGPLRMDRDYVIRLNGTALEFREEPPDRRAQPGTLVVRTADLPVAGIAAGGWPIPASRSDVTPPDGVLLARCDAAFLSTEVSLGYLGCLAGTHVGTPAA